MEQEAFIVANEHVEQAISNALNSLTQIPSSNRTIKSTISSRCRSSSNNRTNRKVSFHKTVQRCSLPATENDLVDYQTRLLSSKTINSTHNRMSRTNKKLQKSNGNFDIQYSFSLNKPCLTKLTKQRSKLIHIKNFADQFIKDSIQNALLQV